MDLGISKCVVTCCSNKSKITIPRITTYLKGHNVNYKTQQLPILLQNEPSTHLGIKLVPSLKWNIHKGVTTSKFKNKAPPYYYHWHHYNKQSKSFTLSYDHVLNTPSMMPPSMSYTSEYLTNSLLNSQSTYVTSLKTPPTSSPNYLGKKLA